MFATDMNACRSTVEQPPYTCCPFLHSTSSLIGSLLLVLASAFRTNTSTGVLNTTVSKKDLTSLNSTPCNLKRLTHLQDERRKVAGLIGGMLTTASCSARAVV